MKKASVIIALFFIVVGCAHKNVPQQATTKTVQAPENTLPTKPSVIMDSIVVKKEPVIDANIAYGQKVYQANCGKCHELKNTKQYTQKSWVPIMDDMAYKANLTSTEKIVCLNYVQHFAKDSGN